LKLEKDWEARFTDRPARKRFSRAGLLLGGGYWALTIMVFLILQSTESNTIIPEALRIAAALTLPWSVLMLTVAGPILLPHPARPYYDPLASSLGTFILLPLICGGLNAIVIYWLVSIIQRRRHRKVSS
jgi:predicted PurR-regulated permease PerM